jgi:acetyl esterase/lipase
MSTKTTKTTAQKQSKPRHVPFYRRKGFVWPVGSVFGLALAIFLAFQLSPWPGVLLVRNVFNKGSHNTLLSLEKHTTNVPITVIENQQYKQHDRNAMLDVYTPQSAVQQQQNLPVVVWTHGGAWVSGNKTDAAPYYKLLAAQGFTVVSVGYTLAPAKIYPTQINELNAAHSYIVANAARFHINANKIFLAGDSAGSQLSSQMAALITNPSYAKIVGITPTLQPSQLAGTALFCGIYKMAGLTEADPNLPKIISWGDDQVVWAYSGTRDRNAPIIQQMSPYYYVTKDFPATFISGGNADPLTNSQSIPLASKLQGQGVSVTPLFYAADHQPQLPHEYQFNLDTSDGQNAFNQLVVFLKAHS